MPQAMALRAQDLTVLGIEATFGELGERFDMMDVEHDLRSAAVARRSVHNPAFLALEAVQGEGCTFPFAVVERAPGTGCSRQSSHLSSCG